MFKAYNLKIATIIDHNDWVKTRAREIEPDSEWHLAVKLDKIMQYFKELHKFAGASSNNITWNRTTTPIRVIHIPATERKHLTLVNPKVMELTGREINSVEGCGSIPDQHYLVKRKSTISISGYTVEKKYIELEYGPTDDKPDEKPVFSSYHNKASIVQHEMDHLDGITIKDKGTLFDLNRFMG